MPAARRDLLFQNGTSTPIGAIRYAGRIDNSRGLDQGEQRRLGSYALVYSLRGACDYWDERNGRRSVGPGDLFLLFPDIPHRYGGADGSWDEFFIVFEGPLFALWQDQGLLDPQHAFWHLLPVDHWLGRLQGCLATPGRMGLDASLHQVCQLQQVLADVMAAGHRAGGPGEDHPAWLQEACTLLSDPAARSLRLAQVAHRLGVQAETFRKAFAAAMGLSPAAWRSARLIDEACRLIATSGITGRQLADDLGFADEYHFSRRFRQITRLTPTQFRERIRSRAGTSP